MRTFCLRPASYIYVQRRRRKQERRKKMITSHDHMCVWHSVTNGLCDLPPTWTWSRNGEISSKIHSDSGWLQASPFNGVLYFHPESLELDAQKTQACSEMTLADFKKTWSRDDSQTTSSCYSNPQTTRSHIRTHRSFLLVTALSGWSKIVGCQEWNSKYYYTRTTLGTDSELNTLLSTICRRIC